MTTPPRAAPDTDDRLTRLEIQLTYAEDLLETLNALVARQQDQIQRLAQELHLLKQQRADNDPAAFRSLRDELPPHY